MERTSKNRTRRAAFGGWMAGLAVAACLAGGAAFYISALRVSAPGVARPPSPAPTPPPASLLLGAPQAYPDDAALYDGPKRILSAGRFDAPPRLDGKLDDAGWAGCPEQAGFVLLAPGGGGPRERTLFRVGAFKETLYVGVVCEESDMPALAVSAKPDPAKSDAAIEEQDTVHVLLTPPHARQIYLDICVNAAGETADTLMNWETGTVGWYYRGGGLNEKLRAVAVRESKRWTVEIEIPFFWTWGADARRVPWGFQLVRYERPRGEISAWNPMETPADGPWRFGLLRVEDDGAPLFLERADLIPLGQGHYDVRCLVRRLVDTPLRATLAVANARENSTPATFRSPVSTVYLPYATLDEAKMKPDQYNSIPVPMDISMTDGAGKKRFLGSFPTTLPAPGAAARPLVMPGLNDKTAAPEGLTPSRLCVPETTSIFQGRRALNVRFDLPLGDDALHGAELFVSTSSSPVDGHFPLSGRRGLFALATWALPVGEHEVRMVVRKRETNLLVASFLLHVTDSPYTPGPGVYVLKSEYHSIVNRH